MYGKLNRRTFGPPMDKIKIVWDKLDFPKNFQFHGTLLIEVPREQILRTFTGNVSQYFNIIAMLWNGSN